MNKILFGFLRFFTRSAAKYGRIALACALVICLLPVNISVVRAAETDSMTEAEYKAYVIENFILIGNSAARKRIKVTTKYEVLDEKYDWDSIIQILKDNEPKPRGSLLRAAEPEYYTLTASFSPPKYSQAYTVWAYELKDGYDVSRFNSLTDQYNNTLISQNDNFTPDVCPNPDLDPRGTRLGFLYDETSSSFIFGRNYNGTAGLLPIPTNYDYKPELVSGFGNMPPSFNLSVPESDKYLVIALVPDGIVAYKYVSSTGIWESDLIDYDRHIQFILVEPSIVYTGPDLDAQVRQGSRIVGRSSDLNYTYSTGYQPYMCGDPVEAVSGAFAFDYSDLKFYGDYPMSFTRHYNSQIKESGSLGKGWTSNFDYSLQIGKTIASFRAPGGYTMMYHYDDVNNEFIPEIGYVPEYVITATNPTNGCAGADSYTVTHIDGTQYLYNSDVKLTKIAQNGKTLYTYEYDSDGALVKVYNEHGGYFLFENEAYTADEITTLRIKKVTDPAGGSVTMTYGNLYFPHI